MQDVNILTQQKRACADATIGTHAGSYQLFAPHVHIDFCSTLEDYDDPCLGVNLHRIDSHVPQFLVEFSEQAIPLFEVCQNPRYALAVGGAYLLLAGDRLESSLGGLVPGNQPIVPFFVCLLILRRARVFLHTLSDEFHDHRAFLPKRCGLLIQRRRVGEHRDDAVVILDEPVFIFNHPVKGFHERPLERRFI